MTEPSRKQRINWQQAWGEALLIFLGVAVALGAQAWWEYRTDRELEQHLLEGMRTDLARDIGDMGSAIDVARARTAGADFLLAELGDPNASKYHPRDWPALRLRPGARQAEADFLSEILAEYAEANLTAREALYMIVATVSMQVLDVSDATFREATEGGQLNVIRDVELRSSITDYYFNSIRFGSTTDARVELQWVDFRRVLAQAGLSTIGGGTDEEIIAALLNDSQAVAELRNVRDYAITQVAALDITLRSAEVVIQMLNGAD